MPRVTEAYARAVAEAAGLTVTDDGAVLSDGAVVRRLRVSDGGDIPEAEHRALVAWIGRHHEDRAALVTAYSERIRPDDLGVLGLAIKTAPTLRASLKRISRYARLLVECAEYRLEETRSRAALVIVATVGPHAGCALRNECALSAVARLLRSVVKAGLQLDGVSFRHACAGDPDAYAALFGCPVRFGRERDEIALQPAMLDLPNRLGDSAVCDFLTRELDAGIDASSDDTSFRGRLVGHLSGALDAGVPQAAEIARRMGMSERTLYRRLAEEGLAYRDLVQEVQIALAQELLAGSECSIAEIACRAGFSEQSAFSRAFKRRVGHTPARYRRRDVHA